MKHLLFLNSPKRRYHMKTRRITRRRRIVRHRRVRRNPPKMTPAMRAKISRAVKAANRRRASRKPAKRSTSTAVVVRRSGPPKMTPAMRRKVSLGVRRANARRRGGIRRFTGGGGGLGKALTIKGLLSKETIQTAGGAVGAGFLTSFIIRRFGMQLPMATTGIGSVAYSLLIPFAGAYLVKNVNRRVAEGMAIGGVVLAINRIIELYVPQVGALVSPPVAGTSEYLNGFASPTQAIGAGYEAVDTFGAGVYDSDSAFKEAWQ